MADNDLISRSALKKDLLDRAFFPAIVKAALENAPAVDAVEVVRCKDCKYQNNAPCPMRLSLNWTEDNDFCSYGERKANDER